MSIEPLKCNTTGRHPMCIYRGPKAALTLS